MRVHRLLVHALSNEPLWVRLYVQSMGDQWTAMIVADSVNPPKPDELVTLQALAVSNAYEIAALVAVLERKGLITQVEVLAGY